MECQRCGACCLTIGRTFWKHGNLTDRPFGDIEELNQRANDDDVDDLGVPCEMFEMRGKIGVCLIQERYGLEAKPTPCKEYPDGELCLREKGL